MSHVVIPQVPLLTSSFLALFSKLSFFSTKLFHSLLRYYSNDHLSRVEHFAHHAFGVSGLRVPFPFSGTVDPIHPRLRCAVLAVLAILSAFASSGRPSRLRYGYAYLNKGDHHELSATSIVLALLTHHASVRILRIHRNSPSNSSISADRHHHILSPLSSGTG